MPETTRNKLRYPAETDTPDVPRDIENLAKDVDVKMASWSEGTHAARPAAGQPNRFYRETDTNSVWHDNGVAWEPIMPMMALGARAAPTEALKGELLLVNGGTPGTVTLPAVAQNAIVAIWNVTAANVTVKQHAAETINGDFIVNAASVELTQYQHVTLMSDGSNWFIVAGEPKHVNTYVTKVATKAEVEAGLVLSATRMTAVIRPVGLTEPSIGGVNMSVTVAGVQLLVPPGQAIKATTTEANVSFLYLLL